MSPHTPNITTLASDYHAIERALRESTRGRWFLNCYLERNRSAETRMLLEAIMRLENAMRENGHIVSSLGPADAIAMVAEAIADARCDIRRMAPTDNPVSDLPTPRYSFAELPEPISAATSDIREAARTIEGAASTLRGAGVFQGVSRQIARNVQTIVGACARQERAVLQMQRIAALVSEIEAEILAATDHSTPDAVDEDDAPSAQICQLHPQEKLPVPSGICGDIINELSAALAKGMAPLSIVSSFEPS